MIAIVIATKTSETITKGHEAPVRGCQTISTGWRFAARTFRFSARSARRFTGLYAASPFGAGSGSALTIGSAGGGIGSISSASDTDPPQLKQNADPSRISAPQISQTASLTAVFGILITLRVTQCSRNLTGDRPKLAFMLEYEQLAARFTCHPIQKFCLDLFV